MASGAQLVFRLVFTTSGDNKLKKFNTGLDDTDKKTKKASKSAGGFSRTLDKVGQAVGINSRIIGAFGIAGVAALAGIGVAAVSMATDFDRSLTKVNTLVGISRDQVDSWKSDLLSLGPETGRSVNELADALFVITSAGAREGPQAMAILGAAAKAAAVGLGETATVARAVTAAIQAYASTGLTAADATDILVATVREGNLEASELAGTLGRVIGIASAVGVSFAEVGGFVATFTRLGVNAEEAVTSLRGVLTSLLGPTEDQEKALLSIGMSMDSLRASIQDRGLAQALLDMVAAAGDNTDALAAIIPNVRALSGVLGTARAQGQQFVEIQDSITNSSGALDKAFAGTKDSGAQAFAELKAAGGALLVTVGDELVPAVASLARILSDLATNEGVITFFKLLGQALSVPLQLIDSLLGGGIQRRAQDALAAELDLAAATSAVNEIASKLVIQKKEATAEDRNALEAAHTVLAAERDRLEAGIAVLEQRKQEAIANEQFLTAHGSITREIEQQKAELAKMKPIFSTLNKTANKLGAAAGKVATELKKVPLVAKSTSKALESQVKLLEKERRQVADLVRDLRLELGMHEQLADILENQVETSFEIVKSSEQENDELALMVKQAEEMGQELEAINGHISEAEGLLTRITGTAMENWKLDLDEIRDKFDDVLSEEQIQRIADALNPLKEAVEEFQQVFAEELGVAIDEGLDGVDWASLGQSLGNIFGAQFGDEVGAAIAAGIQVIGVLASGGDVSDVNFTALGAQIGALWGPWGAAIGTAVGALVDLATASSGAARAIGSLSFGPGFTAIGGTAEAKQMASQGIAAIEAFFARLNALLGEAIQITQNIEIELFDDGTAALSVLTTVMDERTGLMVSQWETTVFQTLQQAVEAGIIALLESAVIPEQFRDVIEQLLAQGMDPETLLKSVSFITGFDRALADLSGSGTAAIMDFQAAVSSMEFAISALGLDAETTAGMLDRLADAAAFMQSQMEVGALNQMADLLGQIPGLEGEAARIRAQAAQMAMVIEIQMTRLQLEALGLMTEAFSAMLDMAADFASQVENFEVDINVGQINVGGLGGGGIRGGRGGRGGPSRIDQDAADRARLLEELERYQMLRLSGPARELQGIRDHFAELRHEAQRLGVDLSLVNEAMRLAISDFMDRLLEPLREFRNELDLVGTTPRETFNIVQTTFQDLVARANRGDLEAIQALPDAGRQYVSAIEQMFGGTRRGQALLDQVRAQVDGVLGVGGLAGQEDPKVRLDMTRNDVLFDIRELLGGEPTPHEQEQARLARERTNLLADASRQYDEQVRHLKEIRDDMKKAARPSGSGATFSLAEHESDSKELV